MFSIEADQGGETAEERAFAATKALERVAAQGTTPEVRVERMGRRAIVLVGSQPVLEVSELDARVAGEPSPDALAAKIASRVRDALNKNQTRNATLWIVLSFGLVLLCGFLSLFLIRKAGELADRMRAWVRDNPDRLPALRVQRIELVRSESLRAALLIGLSASKALAQLGIVYGWVLITLSLFEPTQPYAKKLTGFVFGPLSSLISTVIGSVPLAVVAAIAGITLIVMIRFVGLFFEGVARGQTTLEWLPPDLAAPTSLLVRAALLLAFLVLAAPLFTGDDGALARAGTIALSALGLSTIPLLACGAVGITVVYGRRLRVGDHVEVGGRKGKIEAVTLLEVRLQDDDGREVRVPHLLTLIRPTHVFGSDLPVSVEINLPTESAADADVRAVLMEAAKEVGHAPRVDLVSLDAAGATFRVTVNADKESARSKLLSMIAEMLGAAQIPLGGSRQYSRSKTPPPGPAVPN